MPWCVGQSRVRMTWPGSHTMWVQPQRVPQDIHVDEKSICSYLGLWSTFILQSAPSMFCRISIHSFGRKVTTVQQRGEHALLRSEVYQVLHQFREASHRRPVINRSVCIYSVTWRVTLRVSAPDRLVTSSAVVIPKCLYIKLHHCIINHLPYSSLL